MTETEQQNVPTLRFPGYSGEWEEKRAGELFTNSREKGEAGLPIYSVTLNRGLVRRDSLKRHMKADAADTSNLRVQKGDLAYNMMRMWQGAVGIATEECMVSPAYIILSPKEGACSRLFDFWFKSRRMLYLLWAYSHGLTSDRLRLYFNDFGKIRLRLPPLPEQQKIASFLSSVDCKIEQLGKKKALLEQYKKGMMQKLFSQEVRFKDDQGNSFPDWEEKTFSDALKPVPTKKYQINSSQFLEEGAYPVIDQGKMLIAGYSDEEVKLFSTNGVIVYGDHTTVVKFVDYNFIVGADGTKVLESLGPKIKYLFYCLSFFNVEAEGYKRHFSILKKICLPIPSTDEQQKIADFLSSIDQKIDLVATELDHAKTFKKGLLQQMFI